MQYGSGRVLETKLAQLVQSGAWSLIPRLLAASLRLSKTKAYIGLVFGPFTPLVLPRKGSRNPGEMGERWVNKTAEEGLQNSIASDDIEPMILF